MATAAGEAGSERAAHDPRARLRRLHEVGRSERGLACCAQAAHSSRRANVLLACTASWGRAWRPLVSPCYRFHGRRSSRATADAGIFCSYAGAPAFCRMQRPTMRERSASSRDVYVGAGVTRLLSLTLHMHASILMRPSVAPDLLRVNLCLRLCIVLRA